VIACALSAMLAAAAHAGQPPMPFPIEKDVVYAKVDGVDLHLDLVRPPKGDGPFPLIVCIHGGGWAGGNKAGYHRRLCDFATRGYVAATVQYRFAPKYPFPAQVEDVKCAVRYLRSRAKELKIDPNKVAAMGDSAGGHLSLMLGMMDPADGLEGNGGHADQSSKVQAVVNYYGPTDFTANHNFNAVARALVTAFLNTANKQDPVVAKASPATYITKGDAAVLTFHGTNDLLVPLDQAKVLHEALRKAEVPERIEIIEGGGHGFQGPARDRTHQITYEFLDQYLLGKAPKTAQ
jgi:acetyl esterase/lipase